jgi:Mrp family chromosome partitioning ATPase
MLGGLLGIGLALMWDAMETRLGSPREIAARLGLRLLAVVPDATKSQGASVFAADADGKQGEAFRSLRANLELNPELGGVGTIRTIMVSGAVPGSGTTSVAVNLAVAFARGGRDVILADLNLRNPVIGRQFDLTSHPGITNVAIGRARFDEALVIAQPHGQNESELPVAPEGRLRILPAGTAATAIEDASVTTPLGSTLRALRTVSDIVIVDSPPLGVIGDSVALMEGVDALVVVADSRTLRAGALETCLRMLDNCRARPLGVVLTGTSRGALLTDEPSGGAIVRTALRPSKAVG